MAARTAAQVAVSIREPAEHLSVLTAARHWRADEIEVRLPGDANSDWVCAPNCYVEAGMLARMRRAADTLPALAPAPARDALLDAPTLLAAVGRVGARTVGCASVRVEAWHFPSAA